MQAQKLISNVNTYRISSSNNVQPISGPRNVVINRTAPTVQTTGGQTATSVRRIEMKKSYGASVTPGASSNIVQTGVNSLMNGREKERQELHELNDRFANYIDKVKHLEDENRRLTEELIELKNQWGKETERIKEQFDSDMWELRKSLDAAEAAKVQIEMKINSFEDFIQESELELNEVNQLHNADKETIDKMNNLLADYENEAVSLRRRLTGLEDEKIKDDKEISRLKDEVAQLKKDLDKETLDHIMAQNEVQSLRDKIEFLKKIYESEVRELTALAYKDPTESKDFWRNEMSQALRDIQSEYDRRIDSIQHDMEAQYNLKIQEYRITQTKDSQETILLREENTKLKEQLSDLRNRLPELEARNNELERMLELLRREIDERNRNYDLERANLRKELSNRQAQLENIIAELQILLDAKLSLELEIVAYRKMLEGEEHRVNQKNVMSPSQARRMDVEDSVITRSTAGQSHAAGQSLGASSTTKTQITSSSTVKGEMSAKTSFQRTAKGNVTIQECSPDGKYIILENTGSQPENLSGFKVDRNVDTGRIVVVYAIPEGVILEATGKKRSLKIWAKGCKPSGTDDLECQDANWGIGSLIVTILINKKGEEKATHTQRTVYQM
uniref:LaminB n=1 Tax=Dendrocoelum lacteum TaxID=27895 RepID=T1E1E3_9PLAT